MLTLFGAVMISAAVNFALIGKILSAPFFDAQANGSEIVPGKDFIRALCCFANGVI